MGNMMKMWQRFIIVAVLFLNLYGAEKNERDLSSLAHSYDTLIQNCNEDIGKSCFMLGVYYELKNNFAQALVYFDKACSLGDRQGCFYSATIYHEGLAVEKNLAKAIKNYEKACKKEDAVACYNLGILNYEGVEIASDLQQAAHYFEKTCQLGYVDGCYELGVMYEDGLGVAKDYALAIYYYEKACDGGYSKACLAITE